MEHIKMVGYGNRGNIVKNIFHFVLTKQENWYILRTSKKKELSMLKFNAIIGIAGAAGKTPATG